MNGHHNSITKLIMNIFTVILFQKYIRYNTIFPSCIYLFHCCIILFHCCINLFHCCITLIQLLGNCKVLQ